MVRWLLVSIPLLSLLVACGSSAPPPPAAPDKATAPSPAPADSSAAAAEPAEDAPSKKLPDACSGDAGSCTMPPGFVKRLCSGVHPDLVVG
ncbi:MAG: hypothetical protein WKG00_21195, partial [Polyangiaceae bacterium]